MAPSGTAISPGIDGISPRAHATARGKQYIDWKLISGDMDGRDKGKDWFVVHVGAKNEADPELIESFRLEALANKRQLVWTAYVDELSARARIDTGGGEARQGGWMDWLEPILPD